MDPKEALRIAREAGLPAFGMRAIENDWTQEQLEEAIREEQAKATPENADPTPASDPPPESGRGADPPPEESERSGGASDPPSGDDPTNALSDDSANRENDNNRVTRIYDLGQEYEQRDLAIEAIADPNCSIEDFQKRLLEINKQNKERAAAEQNIPERITLDPKDQRNFRVINLLHYLASGKNGHSWWTGI